jgi:hypothetical protein
MVRGRRSVVPLALAVGISLSGFAGAHDVPGAHSHDADPGPAVGGGGGADAPPGAEDRQTGQGEWTFRWNRELSELPDEARKVLAGAHGGFAVDWQGNRDVYFALKGAGIIRMSADLKKKEVVRLDPFLMEGNYHNTTLIHDDQGKAYLALPDNEKNRVYIIGLDGKVVQVLDYPRGNQYYDTWQPFVPTDVAQAPDRSIYIVTGYSPGDFVVTANPFTGAWNKLIFGGKGAEHGKFNTGHGITWNPRQMTMDIADRPNSRLESYGLDGTYKSTVPLEAGSLPCDLDFMDDFTVVGCLDGPKDKGPAPIYILDKEGKLLSTVKPKADLGLDLFTHVHNATWHAIGSGDSKKVFILAQAWNPGGFAVLELERKR